MIAELISSKSCISPNAVQIRYWLLQSLPISIKLPTAATVTAGFFFIATEIVLGIFMSANSNSEVWSFGNKWESPKGDPQYNAKSCTETTRRLFQGNILYTNQIHIVKQLQGNVHHELKCHFNLLAPEMRYHLWAFYSYSTLRFTAHHFGFCK